MVPKIVTAGPPSPDASIDFAVDEKSPQEGGVSSMPGVAAAADPASSHHHKEKVLVLTKDDFERGEPLGAGTFATVYQIKPRSLALLTHSMVGGGSSNSEHSESSAETASTTPLQQQQPHSRHSSMSSLSTADPFRSFCLKTLNSMALDDRYAIKAGLHCLAAEAKVLSGLMPAGYHPHIIRLVGVSKDGFDRQHPARGFLVLERLSDTLDKKLKLWRFRKGSDPKTKRSLLPLFFKKPVDDPAQRARITEIGLGLAQAMAFLHEHGVLYRDLKPENAGFDATGRVVLFDFGLARQIPVNTTEGYRGEDDRRRKLTSKVGSLRFMSPEMFLGQPYGFSTDVYSFAVLLWEIITLDRPFANMTQSTDQFLDLAYHKHQRPALKNVSAPDLRELLRAAWDPNPDRRPGFDTIVKALEPPAAATERRSSKSVPKTK